MIYKPAKKPKKRLSVASSVAAFRRCVGNRRTDSSEPRGISVYLIRDGEDFTVTAA
jgi:hypothetical protein